MRKRFLCMFLALLMLACVGCADNKSNGSKNEVIAADFESLDEIYTMRFANLFGKADFNTDKKFIKNGNGSLKICPIGNSYLSSNGPILEIRLKDSDVDFSQANKISMDIYNDSDREITSYFYVNFDTQNGKLLPTKEIPLTLKSKAWSKAEMVIDPGILDITYDIKKADSICLKFDNEPITATDRILYVDNVKITKTSQPFTPAVMELDEGEIASFDKLYQEYIFRASAYGALKIYPQISINSDLNFSKSGKSLKVVSPVGALQNDAWPLVEISQKLIKAANISQYDENDSFSYDIYFAGTGQMYIEHIFCTPDEKMRFSGSKQIMAGKWYTVKSTLKDINAKFITEDNQIEKDILLRFSYGGFDNSVEQTFYIDNIKIEK